MDELKKAQFKLIKIQVSIYVANIFFKISNFFSSLGKGVLNLTKDE